MKKFLLSLLIVVFAVLVAIPAEAQGRGRGRNGRGGYGYYDPATIEQMLSLPDGLASCQVDFSTGRVASCRSVVKTAEAIEMFNQNPDGILGSVHVQKGKFHFRPFDDTNRRLGTMEAGALGAGAGALAGYGSTRGMRNRNKANAIGAASTIGGGLFTGWLASRRSHDNCLKIEPTTAQSMQMSNQKVPYEEPIEKAPYKELMTEMTQPVAGPASPTASVTWSTINTTDFRAVVTDPNSGQERLIPAGGSINLPEPAGEQPYTVVLLVPGRGSVDRVPGEIRPSEDLQGWEIVAR